jgi:hypothetical protein
MNFLNEFQEMINVEYGDFETDMLLRSKDHIFDSAFEISFYTNVTDFFNYHDFILDKAFYMVLYKYDNDCILRRLFDWYIKSENTSVDNWDAIYDLIQSYVVKYYYEELKNIQENMYD